MSIAYRFSVADYERMIESGLFFDQGEVRTELIFGEVRVVNPPNPPLCQPDASLEVGRALGV